MSEKEILKSLREENERLKEEKESLLNTVAQMRMTLNRLITHYIVEDNT